MLKFKTQTIISVLGLTIGVVFFAYGYHWYKYETGYDSFYPDSDRIYRVYGIYKNSNKIYDQGYMPYVAIKKLEEAFPEIEGVAIRFPNYGSSLKHEDKDLGYPIIEFVNDEFFHLFPPKVILGTIEDNTLKTLQELIVTESFARKHFGSPEEAFGETIISAYEEKYVISAVIEDPLGNSIFRSEGYVLGVGGNMFKLSGSVIVFGVFSAFVVAIIKIVLIKLGVI